MKTTAIMNLKGGTGKTVSTINLAAFLAVKHGQRVLLIDADSQGNLTEFVSEKLSDKGTIYDLLTGKECIALQPTRMRQVDILQADPRLMALDITAAGMGAADQMALKSFLAENADLYDRVLIDCPPAFSAAAAAALIAADDVIIPMKLDAFGIRGMANLLEQIRNMRTRSCMWRACCRRCITAARSKMRPRARCAPPCTRWAFRSSITSGARGRWTTAPSCSGLCWSPLRKAGPAGIIRSSP